MGIGNNGFRIQHQIIRTPPLSENRVNACKRVIPLIPDRLGLSIQFDRVNDRVGKPVCGGIVNSSGRKARQMDRISDYCLATMPWKAEVEGIIPP